MSRPPWPLPTWALRPAGDGDLDAVRQARQKGVLVVRWRRGAAEDPAALPAAQGVDWARRQGWRISRWQAWWSAEGAFLDAALRDDDRFRLALLEAGAELLIPKELHTLGSAELRALDDLYTTTEDMGVLGRRPTRWDELVADLRELRRVVEAGVVVEVEGRELRTWNDFYTWAHGRFSGLEDGSDAWIGDDR